MKKQMKKAFAIIMVLMMVFAMSTTAFASNEDNPSITEKEGIGFTVSSANGETLTVQEAPMEGFNRYVVDASENSILISSEGPILLDAITEDMNFDYSRPEGSMEDEVIIKDPWRVHRPSYSRTEIDSDFNDFLTGIDISEDEYSKLSVLAIYDSIEDEDFSGILIIRWKADKSLQFDLEGEGTEENPYLIKTSEDLVTISKFVTSGETYSGKYFNLTDNITLPENWTPIGSLKDGITEYGTDSNRLQAIDQTNPFSGNIDGKGFTITVPNGGLPLLGAIKGSTIKNINIYGEKIKGYGLIQYYTVGSTGTIDNVTIKSGSHILRSGLLGGYGNEPVNIYNCTVEKGVIIGDDGTWGDLGDTTYFYMYVGNIDHKDCIGSFAGAWNGTINNCVSYATVYGRNNVGGIVGFKGQSMRDSYVSDCAFYGDIIGTGTMVGGIVGSGYTAGSAPATPCVTIENCYATGNIRGVDKVGGIFGGEAGSVSNWNNGIGRIRNNYFAGTVSTETENAAVGSIIGYMRSMNRYNDVRSNYYVENCGASKPIGAVDIVINQNYKSYNEYLHYGRTDDPMNDNSGTIAKEIKKSQLTDNSLVDLLNSGKFGRNDWQQGKDYPVFGNEKHIIGIVSREYGHEWLECSSEIEIKDDYSNLMKDRLYIIIKYSDGTSEKLNPSVGSFSGVDFEKEGYQLATFTYENYEMTFGVKVTKSRTEAEKINVTVSILGFDPSNAETDVVHSITADNLVTWVNAKAVSTYTDKTALDAVLSACTNGGYLVTCPDGENITALTKGSTVLKNGANGKNGEWLYTINGEYTNTPLGKQTIKDGDVIVFHYSEDQEADYGSANKPDPSPVTPGEDKIKVTFRLIGSQKAEEDVDLSVPTDLPNYETWISTKTYELPEGSTVYDLFCKALQDAGLSETGAASNYVRSITSPKGESLGEFDNGRYSGWMYTVNGSHVNVGLLYYSLKDGDQVIWHYVNDYRWEVEDWFDDIKYPSLAMQQGITKYYNGWLKVADTTGSVGGGISAEENAASVTTTGTTGSAITTTPTEVSVSGSTATATVKAENATELLKQAKENKSGEIVVNVAAADSKGANTVKANLETSLIKSIVSDTTAKVTVQTENGNVTLDQDALKKVSTEAKASTVSLEVTKVTNPTAEQKKAVGDNASLITVTLKSGTTELTDLSSGKAAIRIEVPTALKDKKTAAVVLNADGTIKQLEGKTVTVGTKVYYEFETAALGTFALVDADEAGLDVPEEDKNAAIAAGVENTTIKLWSTFSKKNNIQLNWTKSKGYKVDYYEVFKSTKRFSGFGTKAYYKTSTGTKNFYINTKELKKGTRYFYKVRGVRIINGEKVYTQWSNKAWRISRVNR